MLLPSPGAALCAAKVCCGSLALTWECAPLGALCGGALTCRVFDEDESKNKGGPLRLLIDEGEFGRCLRDKLGFRGRPSVITDLFDELDADGDGEISFDEVRACVRAPPFGRPS